MEYQVSKIYQNLAIPEKWESVVELYSPKIIKERVEKFTSISAACDSKEYLPSMAKVRRHHGKENILVLIRLYLIRLDEELNLSRRLNENTIEAIADDIYEVAYFLSIEELVYFFKGLRRGEYGSLYQGLNSETVIKGLQKYSQNRSTYWGGKSEDESKRIKGRTDREIDGEKTESIAELTAQMELRNKIKGYEKLK